MPSPSPRGPSPRGHLGELTPYLPFELVDDYAAAVGVAPSTALARVRALRSRGVIRGFHAEVDPAWIGRPIQAMIVQPGAPLSQALQLYEAANPFDPGIAGLVT